MEWTRRAGSSAGTRQGARSRRCGADARLKQIGVNPETSEPMRTVTITAPIIIPTIYFSIERWAEGPARASDAQAVTVSG